MATGISYIEERNNEQLRMLGGDIARFVRAYRPWRPTVILLVGGMASRIARARTPFQDGDPPAELQYDTVWLNLFSVWTDQELKMNGDIDSDNRICVATGPIALPCLDPYGRFARWCEDNQFNHIIFSWDWRRQLDPIVDFFTNCFLPKLQSAVQEVHGSEFNCLQGATLVGHSEGGFLVKLFLHGGSPYVPMFARAVTVGTPFYGYAYQVPRYFAGMNPLNYFSSPKIMAELIATLLGGYALFFTDLATFERDRALLEADRDYPPPQWPCVDTTIGSPFDPYNPWPTQGAPPAAPAPAAGAAAAGSGAAQPAAVDALSPYPTDIGFQWDQLPKANAVRTRITDPLPPELNARFYNVRGVQAAAIDVLGLHFGAGGPAPSTAIGLNWGWVAATFSPGSGDKVPIGYINGAGDDTIPAWSARLVSIPAANVITVVGDQNELSHQMLMDNDAVLARLGALIASSEAIVTPSRTPADTRQPASSAELVDFMRQHHAVAGDKQATRALLANYDQGKLQGLALRFMIDLHKGVIDL